MSDSPCPAPSPPPCNLPAAAQDSKPVQQPKQSCATGAKQGTKKKLECIDIWHPGFDARFPNMNQTRRCWQNYVDYFRCLQKFGDDYEPCEYYRKTYSYLCPGFWVEQWDDQRENGVFPGLPNSDE